MIRCHLIAVTAQQATCTLYTIVAADCLCWQYCGFSDFCNGFCCFSFLLQITNMKEIILIGSYQLTKQLNRFITNVQQEFKIVVRCECWWCCYIIGLAVGTTSDACKYTA